MSRRPLFAALAAALALATPGVARATPYRLTREDRAEIERLLRAFFEAARDGNAAATAATIPTAAEFRTLFAAGMDALLERHQSAIQRDVRELRQHFAQGTWAGLSGSFTTAPTVDLRPCGRFAAPRSQCTLGPVIDWRVGTETHHMRVDTLVRLNGHWRIFDPRL
jgi:hypothetical protein